MTVEIPPYYDDLELSLSQARLVMETGAASRHSAAHCPVVASLDHQGRPTQRVMILRAVDWQARNLRFHTDLRSIKVGEVAASALASVLFYEPNSKLQLRLQGRASIETDTVLADAAWSESTEFARRCYLAEAAPGAVSDVPLSGLPAAMEGVKPSSEEVAPARPNFAVMLVEFSTIEWLYLSNAGHRRARWHWDGARKSWLGEWLVP